ncbi:protein S40-1-like [Phragmites australis]|uniref:protein S40-1-like n=1 Tax=Phragmites australis TaxID=29695 RepID=UPI002D779D78|nr:protein S40-1-like [Phragmites australis]
MAMEELDEFELLWPDTCHAHAAHELPASPPVSVQVQVQPTESSTPRPKQRGGSARSRPVDVPNPRVAPSHRWNGRDGGDDDEEDGRNDIVPPHLLVSGRRRSEAETAWTLRASGPPCKRARDLRDLRNSVLRMTGFIEG